MGVPDKHEYPIKLGTLLFTMVEPHKGHEVEYNRWYEHDHYYAGCMIGEYQFAGDRFVATRRLKNLRTTDENNITPDPLIGSYLAIYWVLDGHHEDWNRWAVDQVNFLHANGRMFAERDHIHTLLYDHKWSVRRDVNGCPIEQALDHNYPGLVAVIGDIAEGHTFDDFEAWFRDDWFPASNAKGWGPELVGTSIPLPLLDDVPGDVGRTAASDTRFLQLHFLDRDPEAGWADGYGKVGEQFADGGLATVAWASPFVQTDFGTDKYTDELW
jgi:hypothetical protein